MVHYSITYTCLPTSPRAKRENRRTESVHFGFFRQKKEQVSAYDKQHVKCVEKILAVHSALNFTLISLTKRLTTPLPSLGQATVNAETHFAIECSA